MTRKEQIRIRWRFLKIEAKDRAFDLINMALPIFITSGMVVACVKFWWWLL